jgi:chorismate synthase
MNRRKEYEKGKKIYRPVAGSSHACRASYRLRQYKDGYRAGSRSTAASGDIRGSGE